MLNSIPQLKKMSNTKSVVSEPSKPAEETEEAGVIVDSEDTKTNIPNGIVEELKVQQKDAKKDILNGKVEKLKVQKQDAKKENAKGARKNDGKVLLFSVKLKFLSSIKAADFLMIWDLIW